MKETMNTEIIKKHIITVLMDHKDKLAIDPTLLIDKLFDEMDQDTVNDILGLFDEMSLTPEIKGRMWDRYLMPTLARENQLVFRR